MGFIKVNLEASKSITTLVTVNLFDSDYAQCGNVFCSSCYCNLQGKKIKLKSETTYVFLALSSICHIHGNAELPSEMTNGLAQFLSDEIEYLEKIIQILEDKKSKCKHPKKYRDKVGNVWYCMNCNDLIHRI